MAYVHNGATELNFDGVDIDEVFFTVPIISVLQRYEQFIQIYVNDPNQHVPLPPKITRDNTWSVHGLLTRYLLCCYRSSVEDCRLVSILPFECVRS